MKPDPWLSKIMNSNCYDFSCTTIEEYLSHRKFILDLNTFFVTLRTSQSPANKLDELGKTFRYITTMNSYIWIPDSMQVSMEIENIKIYNAEDYTSVLNIADNAFTADRFHNDPRISKTFADKIKLDWLKSNLLKHRETVTFIYTSQDERNILGFNSMVIKENSIAIDLIAVSKGFRRLGIAKKLVDAGKKLAAKRELLLTVGTQKNNIANDLYLKNGFKLKETYFVSHDTNATFY